MARLTNKHARTKPHRLFEDSRYVPPEKTASLLDESMWSQADTLNDDEHDSSIEPEKFISRNAPQVTDQSDTNPSPDSANTNQSTQQGEQERSNVDNAGGGIADDYDSEPRQGDDWVGRPELFRNFPSDKNNINDPVSSGSGQRNAQQQPVVENPETTDIFGGVSKMMPKKHHQSPRIQTSPAQDSASNQDQSEVSQTTTVALHRTDAQLFGGGLGFDLFMQIVGNSDSITSDDFKDISKNLSKILMNAGVIQQPQYKINRQLYDKIVSDVNASGIDPEDLDADQLNQIISGALQQDIQRRNQPGAGAGGAGTSPLAEAPQQQEQEPATEQTIRRSEFDLSKIPNAAKSKLIDVGEYLGELPERSEEILNEIIKTGNKNITVGQFLEMSFDQLPQPMSPGQIAAEDVEQKRGPYQEPSGLATAQALVDIPEESDPDFPAPSVPALDEGEGRNQFTEEEFQEAKQAVYTAATQIEKILVQQKAQQQQQTQPVQPAPADAPSLDPMQQAPGQSQSVLPEAQQIQQVLSNLREQGFQDVPESFENFDQLTNWMNQKNYQVRYAVRKAVKQILGIDMSKIMKIEDVRRVSPIHAQKMEDNGIEWVEQEPFMARLRKEVAQKVAAAQDPVKMVHTLRREGKSFNHINGEIISGFISGHYDSRQRDFGHVALHRMAQRTVDGTFNITASDLQGDVSHYVELMAAKSEVTPKNYVKQASKQIRATDYTLYNMKADSDASDFNYADPFDVEWTLHRQTEGGKKGAKLDVMKSPSCAIMCASDHGDGEYLVRGQSMLDEVYWGTYTIKVQNGIVTQYAKVPVDKDGKRMASAKDDIDSRIKSRRKYVAIYRAMVKAGLIEAQINSDPAPGWENFPESDEEIDSRMQQIQQWQDRRQQQDQDIEKRIKMMAPKIENVDFTSAVPTQEEADAAYEEGLQKLLQENPAMTGNV
jgi:hypothetical protein